MSGATGGHDGLPVFIFSIFLTGSPAVGRNRKPPNYTSTNRNNKTLDQPRVRRRRRFREEHRYLRSVLHEPLMDPHSRAHVSVHRAIYIRSVTFRSQNRSRMPGNDVLYPARAYYTLCINTNEHMNISISFSRFLSLFRRGFFFFAPRSDLVSKRES